MSTITETRVLHLSHDMVCCYCEHARHTYLPCSDTCDCVPPPVPGIYTDEPERARGIAHVDTPAWFPGGIGSAGVRRGSP